MSRKSDPLPCLLRADPAAHPGNPAWAHRHNAAIRCPSGVEAALVHGWRSFARWRGTRPLPRAALRTLRRAYRAEYGSRFDDDGVLYDDALVSPTAMLVDRLEALRGLLNGDHGRLDGGVMDAAACAMGLALGLTL